MILASDMKQRSKVLLNKDFLRIFYPFYFLNSIVCVRKFNISDTYVYSISRKNIVCAIIFHCIMTCFYFINIRNTIYSIKTYKMVYNIIYIEYLFNYSAVCINNLLYSSTFVHLLSVMNEINRSLYSLSDLKKLKIISRGSIVFLLCCCITLVAFKLAYDRHWTLLRGIYVSTSVILDLEVARTMVFIYMLACKTERWNKYVENMSFGNVNDEITSDREAVLEEMFNAINSVIEAWNLTKKTSAFMILFHFITTFIQTLVYVGVLIIWSKSNNENKMTIISHTCGVMLWLTKVFLIEVGLCITCERFYKEIARVRRNVLLKSTQDLSSKRIWKNIYRVIHTKFAKMSACGVFTVDAATLVHFCSAVTTYTIVLLQFAFL